MTVKLILASSSQHRIDIIKRMGYEIDSTYSPDIDETQQKKELPKNLAIRLSIEKCEKANREIANERKVNKIIISADTVCAMGRTSLPKAMTKDEARLCINKLSGRRHRIYTGVTGICNDHRITKVSMSIIKFKLMTQEEISFFLESKNWYGKAGGYGLQGIASRFIQWISGSDSNIIGLPCYETSRIIEALQAGSRIDDTVSPQSPPSPPPSSLSA